MDPVERKAKKGVSAGRINFRQDQLKHELSRLDGRIKLIQSLEHQKHNDLLEEMFLHKDFLQKKLDELQRNQERQRKFRAKKKQTMEAVSNRINQHFDSNASSSASFHSSPSSSLRSSPDPSNVCNFQPNGLQDIHSHPMVPSSQLYSSFNPLLLLSPSKQASTTMTQSATTQSTHEIFSILQDKFNLLARPCETPSCFTQGDRSN
jgi:hypothetical protein